MVAALGRQYPPRAQPHPRGDQVPQLLREKQQPVVPNPMHRWGGCMPENILILRCVLEEVASHLSQSEIGQLMSRSEEPLIIIPSSPHLVLVVWHRCCNSSMSQLLKEYRLAMRIEMNDRSSISLNAV